MHSKPVSESLQPSGNGFSQTLPLLVVFYSQIFFAAYSILGLTYEGSENSNSYRIYIAVIVSISLIFATRGIFSGGLRLGHFFLMLLPTAVIIMFLITVALGNASGGSWNTFILWLFTCLPAFMAGIATSKTDQLKKASLIVEPLMLIFTAASTIYAMGNLMGGLQVNGLGGATYQAASYLSALAFGLNMYHLLFGRNHKRWKFTQSGFYTVFSIVLLPIQMTSALLAGGRGGFVLIIVYLVALIVLACANRHKSRLGLGLFAITVLALVLYAAVPALLDSRFGPRIVERVFSYMSTDGLIWENTSGRDGVFAEAWSAILHRPVIGYGAFNWGMDDYPHNILLEILLNGGVLYLSVCLFILFMLILRIGRRSRLEPQSLILVAIGLFPFVMLMFSGSYWSTAAFWYVLGAGLSCWPRNRPAYSDNYHQQTVPTGYRNTGYNSRHHRVCRHIA